MSTTRIHQYTGIEKYAYSKEKVKSISWWSTYSAKCTLR